MNQDTGWWQQTAEWMRRAFSEFLTVPSLVIAGFILLSVGCYFLDDAFWSANKEPSEELRWLGQVFGDVEALSSLLGTIVTGLFTVTSITFSLLLLTVQQAGASFTNEVFGQFLRRSGNQLYFGYFVGLSIFALLSLVVANGGHRPVFATTVTVVLAAVSLFLIVLLTYTTIDQMRPHTILDAIRGYVLKARERQMSLLRQTRRHSALKNVPARQVRSERCGYVMSIKVEKIAQAVAKVGQGGFEIKLVVRIGDYVAYDDLLAELRCKSQLPERDADAVAKTVIAAIGLEDHRALDHDPAYGLEQLATIGWTIISTARSNPYPGLLICRMLRDIVGRWRSEGTLPEDRSSPVVYDDRVQTLPFDVLETMIVVASESMQPQTLAELTRTLASWLPELPPGLQDRIDDMVLRSLSALGDHVLTRELEEALDRLSEALTDAGHGGTAEALATAKDKLSQSVGALNARSTRAQAG